MVVVVAFLFVFPQGTRPVSSGLSRSRFRRVPIGPEAEEEDDDASERKGRQTGGGNNNAAATVDEESFSPPKISSLSRETTGKKVDL